MNDLTREQIAWLAGIFEGEGCCTFSKKGRHFRATVTMCDLDVLERFYDFVGVGTLNGPYEQKDNSKWQPYWTWYVGSVEGISFLEVILPWLCERRRKKVEETIAHWKNNRQTANMQDPTCVRGHDLDLPNSRYTRHNTSNGKDGTYCRLCRNEDMRKWRATQKT